jgi:hypothetical protein
LFFPFETKTNRLLDTELETFISFFSTESGLPLPDFEKGISHKPLSDKNMPFPRKTLPNAEMQKQHSKDARNYADASHNHTTTTNHFEIVLPRCV